MRIEVYENRGLWYTVVYTLVDLWIDVGSYLMIKNLVKHGNSYALVIDQSLMQLLGIEPDTQLKLEIREESSI
ncbi:MAG: hypothetical protein U0105_14405 [Candidatus Obscuribacterales bacterium]